MRYIQALIPLFCGLLFSVSGLHSQSLSEASQSIKQELDAATEEYSKLQERIREEKIPLSRERNRLEREVREKEKELNNKRRRRDARQSSLLDLRDRLDSLRQNIGYMENLFNDFNRRFEVTINIAEKELYQEQIETVSENAQTTEEEVNYKEIFKAQDKVVSSALDRIVASIGGRSFNGSAVAPGGEIKEGTFVVTGPSAFFSSEDGLTAGLISRKQPVRPNVIDIGYPGLISSVAQTGSGLLPQDPTLNDAIEIELHRATFFDEIKAGGVWIWPIIAFFTLSMLTAIFKFFSIFSVSRPSENVLQEILELVNDGKKDEAMEKAKKVKGPFGLMLVDAVSFSGDSRELLEEVLYERMLETQPKLESLLPFIAVTAATAPLLGLLGTVTGMINTFEQITIFGTSDASKLAGGISEALVTTKYGLITAIPALIVHALLSRRAQGVMATMEKYSAAFVNGLTNGKSGK